MCKLPVSSSRSSRSSCSSRSSLPPSFLGGSAVFLTRQRILLTLSKLYSQASSALFAAKNELGIAKTEKSCSVRGLGLKNIRDLDFIRSIINKKILKSSHDIK